MMERNVIYAGGSGMTGLLFIFLLWVLSKMIEAVWERLTRHPGNGIPGAKEVAEVLNPKKSALSEDVSKFIKVVDEKLKEAVKQVGR